MTAPRRSARTTTVVLCLHIHNNNRYLRGRKRALDTIELFVLRPLRAVKRPDGDYELTLEHRTDVQLDELVDDVLRAIAHHARDGNCFSESEAWAEGTDRRW